MPRLNANNFEQTYIYNILKITQYIYNKPTKTYKICCICLKKKNSEKKFLLKMSKVKNPLREVNS